MNYLSNSKRLAAIFALISLASLSSFADAEKLCGVMVPEENIIYVNCNIYYRGYGPEYIKAAIKVDTHDIKECHDNKGSLIVVATFPDTKVKAYNFSGYDGPVCNMMMDYQIFTALSPK